MALSLISIPAFVYLGLTVLAGLPAPASLDFAMNPGRWSDSERMKKSGMADFISKPVDTRTLLVVIERNVSRAREKNAALTI